ncbi:hypothetical protein [Streptomyces sp. NPDC051183]|uniref:hypothetical protein n=1 Tax=Streptomyces sp. NPDC051183 TaxID=3155165 RepID=UPI00343A7298
MSRFHDDPLVRRVVRAWAGRRSAPAPAGGCDGEPTAGGDGALALPGFWAGYLARMWATDDSVGPLFADWFGTDAATADAAWEAHLRDAGRFRVPFGGGHSVWVVSCDFFPTDWGTEFYVTHPDWAPLRGGARRLATTDDDVLRRLGFDDDGYRTGPGLSWRELVHVAGTPDTGAPDVHDPYSRLLLLLPALGDADLPSDAPGVVGAALVSAGVPAAGAAGAAAFLLGRARWEAAHWTVPAGRAPGIARCDVPSSPRYGPGLARGLSRRQVLRLARALRS